jgi:hypothetical protein
MSAIGPKLPSRIRVLKSAAGSEADVQSTMRRSQLLTQSGRQLVTPAQNLAGRYCSAVPDCLHHRLKAAELLAIGIDAKSHARVVMPNDFGGFVLRYPGMLQCCKG